MQVIERVKHRNMIRLNAHKIEPASLEEIHMAHHIIAGDRKNHVIPTVTRSRE